MRLSTRIFLALAVLEGWGAAQSAIEEGLATYPECSRSCLEKNIPSSGCLKGNSTQELECLCTNTALQGAITECVLSSCTIYEGLMVKNATETLCGAKVRNESATPLLVGVIGGAVALLVFIGRMLAAVPSEGRMLGWDDWTMLATVLLAAPPTVFSVLLSINGLGKDIWTLPLKNIENVLFYYYLGEIFYFAALSMTKISLLLFMLRVFPDQAFRIKIYVVIGLCAGYGLAFVLATTFQCTPVDYSWLQIDSTVKGHCNDINLQGWMSAIWNIVIDLTIIVLPLKNIYQLHLPLKKKLLIMFMFSLGIFVTVVSAIRLQSLILFANTQNPTYDYNDAAWWSIIELHIGIICACLPSIRSLLVILGARFLGSSKGTSQKSIYVNDNSVKRSRANTGRGIDDKGFEVPKRGDEGDFIPLVEIQSSADKAPNSKSRVVRVKESYDSDLKSQYHSASFT
ncbi:CFEM domain-containing protein [Xylariaceae sp. FL0255]|nr:CFEM domain-containing protein [Xylariaceae sp. FL0255]